MTIKSTFSDLYHEKTNYQFMSRKWRWLLISSILIAVSVGSFIANGLNTSIEFKGGTSFEATLAEKQPDVGQVRDLLANNNLGELKIQTLNNDTIKVTAKRLSQDQQAGVLKELSEYASVDQTDISISDVGPSWGKRVTKQSTQALVVFFLLVALYMIFRFEWAMSLAAILSMLHDVIITVGIYSLLKFNVAPATVVAFLTILGFSLYDTVVVFDKIRDNTKIWKKLKQASYSDMVNTSLNEVLARSINTSIVAVLPVLSLIFVGTYLLGATALLDFSLALAVGLAAGAYSSIFVATPLVVVIKKWTNKADNM
ncbi:MAG TPA: protein translocase subunit SecF [Acidimicrobiia bacterium]|nr:protein translocase subunit SecF [Acidimicrobiia bacterium]